MSHSDFQVECEDDQWLDLVAKQCLMSNVNLCFDSSNVDSLPAFFMNADLTDKLGGGVVRLEFYFF